MDDSGEKRISRLTLLKTIGAITLNFALGLSEGIVGPTFVHLEQVLNTDTQGLALSFIGENIGSILGAVLSGLFFDKLNHDIQFAIASTLLGICLAVAPCVWHVFMYYGIVALQHTVVGFSESSVQSYVLQLWTGHRFKDMVLHISNTICTIGAFICPFIVIPFLSELPQHAMHNDKKSNFTYISDLSEENITFSTLKVFQEVNKINKTSNFSVSENGDVYKVRYAYLTVSLSTILATIVFLTVFVLNTRKLKNGSTSNMTTPTKHAMQNGGSFLYKNKEDSNTYHDSKLSLQNAKVKYLGSVQTLQSLNEDENKSTSLPKITRKSHKFILMLMIACFVAISVMPEYTFGIYISTFVIKGLVWKVHNGPLITSVFRGAQGIGQVCGIPLSVMLSPTKILMINLASGVLAFSLILFVPFYPDIHILVWISAALAGLSVSTVYTSIILWGAMFIKVTSRYGSVIVIASAVGAMTEAALTGYLMQNYTHMWLVYLSLAANICNMILLIIMYFTGNRMLKIRKKQSKLTITEGISQSSSNKKEKESFLKQ